jgi:hypothetical protein
VTGPFVVLDYACLPLRKACIVDHAGVLRFAPAPLDATRFDTIEVAVGAISHSCALVGWSRDTYQIVPLADWEEAQFSPGRRRKKKAVEEAEA